MYDGVITDTAKQCAIAAVLWIIGSIIFLMAVYKLYQPKQPPEPPRQDCGCGPCFACS